MIMKTLKHYFILSLSVCHLFSNAQDLIGQVNSVGIPADRIWYVTGLYVDGLTVDFSGAGGYWKHAVYCENSKDIVLNKCSSNTGGAVKLVSHIGATNSSLRILDCIGEQGIKLISADNKSHIISRGCEKEMTGQQ
jgi:hypothetical protein